jgi:hypothetical protein
VDFRSKRLTATVFIDDFELRSEFGMNNCEDLLHLSIELLPLGVVPKTRATRIVPIE